MTTQKRAGGTPRVVLVHAYSRANAGDGLLVDESAELVREAFPEAELGLIALDPGSFPEFRTALHPLYGSGRRRIVPILRAALGRLDPSVARSISGADLVVAVGGGYLRANSVRGFAKTALAHLSQLPAADAPPTIYLPQSIGPLPRGGHSVRKLRNARRVFVRDDFSLTLLQGQNVPVKRMPDLALLSPLLGNARPIGGEGFGLVARDLGRKERTYDGKIRKLQDRLDARPLIQSTGRGNDDPSYYQRIGLRGHYPSVAAALASPERPSVVISVRLHGSLQSLHSGVPTIHLSYERKGWGAFEDLGLAPFVHSARKFDFEQVVEQAKSLAADPSAYWEAVTNAKQKLQSARGNLIRSMQESVRGA